MKARLYRLRQRARDVWDVWDGLLFFRAGIQEHDEGVTRDENTVVDPFHGVDLAFFDHAIDRGAAHGEMPGDFGRVEKSLFR